MQIIRARKALLEDGWQYSVEIEIDDSGRIASVNTSAEISDFDVGLLLPALTNLHSHGFQRAMAGMTERRSGDSSDNFWAWRQLMYAFLQHLTPDDIQSITAFAQMEMLQAGFAAVAEFHYLHHQVNGRTYADPAELSRRVCAAAQETGIGLTLLPVYYEQANSRGKPLTGAQRRFRSDLEQYARLIEQARKATELERDWLLGIAPHSLRAVAPDSLTQLLQLAKSGPVHMHIAEQPAEVEEIIANYGRRPVEWLFDQHEVDERWCLIHATHTHPKELASIAASGAVVGLCPVTEANLGDGLFNVVEYSRLHGRFGIGTDSNINISMTEELRLLEYGQRLVQQQRALLATEYKSCGNRLYHKVLVGGAQAAGRDSGAIRPGKWADLVAFKDEHPDLVAGADDTLLDRIVFTAGETALSDVWSAGRHMVRDGRHIACEAISQRYINTLQRLDRRIEQAR